MLGQTNYCRWSIILLLLLFCLHIIWVPFLEEVWASSDAHTVCLCLMPLLSMWDNQESNLYMRVVYAIPITWMHQADANKLSSVHESDRIHSVQRFFFFANRIEQVGINLPSLPLFHSLACILDTMSCKAAHVFPTMYLYVCLCVWHMSNFQLEQRSN